MQVDNRWVSMKNFNNHPTLVKTIALMLPPLL
jgi:hypothetical protein